MRLALIPLLISMFSASIMRAENTKPIQLILDTSEADQALAILAKQKAHVPVSLSDW